MKRNIKKITYDTYEEQVEVTYWEKDKVSGMNRYTYSMPCQSYVVEDLALAPNAADFRPQLDRLLTAKRLFDEGYALLKELR